MVSDACIPCITVENKPAQALLRAVLPDCPEAGKQSNVDATNARRAELCSVNTPGLCLFCTSAFTPKGLSTHIRRSHFTNGPVTCPACIPGDISLVVFKDYKAWRIYTIATHHPTGSGIKPIAAADATDNDCMVDIVQDIIHVATSPAVSYSHRPKRQRRSTQREGSRFAM